METDVGLSLSWGLRFRLAHFLTFILTMDPLIPLTLALTGARLKAQTLKRFFSGMSREQRHQLKAVVMDMWDPYIVAVQTKVPHVKIVFDLFHMVAQFNRMIDKVRNSEYRKASQANKEVFKGTKYLLLKNRANIRRPKDRQHLEELLQLNKVIKRKAYGFHDLRYFSLKIIQAFAN
jgi:transposase